MSLFLELTTGFDWELWVCKRSGLPIDGEALEDVLDAVERELGAVPGELDLGQLELHSGICRSAAEVRERARRVHGAAARVVARRGLRLFPGAGHPAVANSAGGHVHVGTIADLAAAERARLRLLPHVPALIALAAASPFGARRAGGHKSYRVAFGANGCLRPVYAQATALAQPTWGEDVCLKLREKPTIELRCFDSAASVEVAAELTILAAGLVAAEGERAAREPAATLERAIDKEAYLEALANRFNAHRHGLQATFRVGGLPVEAGAAALAAIEAAGPGLARLGASAAADLQLCRRMAELRTGQADWLRAAGRGAPDAFARAAQLVEVASALPFERWLERRARPLAARPHEPVARRLDARVRGYMPWTRLQVETWLPAAEIDAYLRARAARGELDLVVDTRRGLACEPRRGAAVEAERARGTDTQRGALAAPGTRPTCTGTWQPCSSGAERAA